ncbi:MAG: sensor histidine kinase [Phototrophicaceae bacterium]
MNVTAFKSVPQEQIVTLGQRLTQASSVEDLLSSFVQALTGVFGLHNVRLYLASSAEHHPVCVLVQDRHTTELYPEILSVDPLIYQVMESGKVFYDKKLLYLPVKYHDQQIGVCITALEASNQLASLTLLLGFLAVAWSRLMIQPVEQFRLNAMRDLTSAIAHQLNNPLSTVLIEAEMLLTELPAQHPLSPRLKAIVRASHRAGEVVRRLMTITHNHSPEGIPQAFDVRPSMADILALFEAHFTNEGIQLSTEFADPLPNIWAVPEGLGDVWYNLLMNAREAVLGQPNPQIGVVMGYHPNIRQLEVRVWDNGVGLPTLDQAQLFKPFYSTKSQEHPGLGLYVCEQVLSRSNATLRLRQRAASGTEAIVLFSTGKEF